MGEIAEALRRARERRGNVSEEAGPPAPSTPRAAPPAPRVAPPAPERPRQEAARAPAPPLARGEAAAGHHVHTLRPTERAIVLSHGAAAEACRGVAVRIRAQLDRRGVRSLAVVSSVSGEGKTTVLCDLGLALASLSGGREVALVDLDLRKPSLGRMLGTTGDIGVESVLSGEADLEAVRVRVEEPALDCYPALAAHRAPHKLLALPALSRMIDDLERSYTYVLIDTPPALLFPDAGVILGHVGACIPVVRAGVTRTRSYRNLMRVLPRGQVLGGLLNSVQTASSYESYYEGYDPNEHGEGQGGRLPGGPQR